jgi:sugar transport system substrate-binding protein
MSARRFLQLLAALMVLAMVLSACTPAAQPAPATAAPQQQAEPTKAPEAAPAAGKMTIAGVVFQSDTFMQTVQAGMQAAADKAGVELILGNTDNKLDKEASMIDDYISRGVDAIVITPISADGSVAALKRAKDAGIQVICFNTCVNDKSIPSAFLVTKNEDLGMKSGEAAVKFINEKLGGKAKVGILNCDQFEGCPPRKEGFLAQLKAVSGAQVVADQAGWLADKAQPVSEAMLQANPDINVLWAANEGGTVAHANAVKTLGLSGKVFVFGTDMNNQMGQMLQAGDGILQGVTGQAPYQMGYDALNQALEVFGGKQVAEVTNTPTIFFGRGQDALINQFIQTEGKAIFEVPAAGESAPAPSGEKPLIAGVVFQSDTFMQTVQAGMQAAADKLGAEVLLGNTDNKLDKEASMIDDYISRGVDAIVITPISADGSVAALKRAKDAGIQVICFNTCVNDKSIPSAFLVTKNEDLGMKSGEAAVKFINEKLGGKAKVGILNCDQFEGCPPRKEGFLAQLKAVSGAQVVADQAGWLADKAQPVSEAMLQANPDINVLWAANEGGTVAHANAVKTLGLSGKVFVFGTDMNNQMGQMLQAGDGVLQGVTGQAPYQMGYDALATAMDVLAGKTAADVTNTPTIFFGRGQDALIKQFMDTEGKAIFEVPAAGESSSDPMPNRKLTVAGVVFQSDTFMQTVQAGMQAAADKAGVELILGNTDNKLDKEASMIDDYISRGVDAIVITPISADGSVAALKRAKDAGIQVICFNTCVNDKSIPSAFLVTKNEDLGMKSGEAAVKFINEKLGGKAKVGILNCDQFEGCPPRKEGFLAQLKAVSGAQVVADQAGWLADKAQPVSEAMLQANPDINVLWAANEGGTVAHANAVKTLGLSGKVFVFGTDMNNQMGQMLQAGDGVLQGVTGQAPYQMGYDAFMAMVRVVNGEKLDEVTNTPTIFFGRGQDALIKQFMDTEGKAIFK